MTVDSLINWAIFLACVGVGHTCACRLKKMHRKTKRIFRAKYAVLGAGALAAGAAPLLFPVYPRLGGLIFAISVLAFLVLGMQAWKGHAPDYSESDKVPFDPFATGEWIAKRSGKR